MEKPDEVKKTRIEESILSKKEWLGREIKPISLNEVESVMRQHYAIVLGFDDTAYTTTRGVGHLLDDKWHDYAKLPPLGNKTAMQIFKSFKPENEWLDLGCGSGTFIAEVLDKINPKINATGFDARKWSSQEDIPELVLGDIDRIDKSLFPKHPKGFDLITSASVFYHLTDYWGALGKTIDLLKPGGEMSISTIVRPMSGDRPINNESGEFTVDPYDYGAIYYRNRNIFDSNGKLMSMAEAVRIINSQNPGFNLEYHSGEIENVTIGEQSYGGGFSGKKLDAKPIDLSFIFYCFYSSNYYKGEVGITDISFIVARSKEEVDKLRLEGFVSVQDRIG